MRAAVLLVLTAGSTLHWAATPGEAEASKIPGSGWVVRGGVADMMISNTLGYMNAIHVIEVYCGMS